MLQELSEKQFIVNEFITLKLENNKTNIYVKNRPFNQCKHLLINLDSQNLEKYDSIGSIDEAVDVLNKYQYGNLYDNEEIPPEAEFWGHCSNLQAWVEHNYDTRLLHRNIAFPLLKKLTEVGDPIARRRFKEEIALRFQSGHPSVVRFLIREHYLNYLNREEINFLCEDLIDSFVNTKKPVYSSKLRLILDTLRKLLIKTKSPTEIIEIYERLLSIEPHNRHIWKYFTQFYNYLIEGQLDPLPSFLPPILYRSNNADFWKNIGYYYYFRGDINKCVNALEKTLELEPLSVPALITLMIAYDRVLELDKSIKLCKLLIKTIPENQNFLLFDVYYYLKKYIHLTPLEFYDHVIEIEPVGQKLMFQNKNMSKRRRKGNLSLEQLTKLSEANPKNIIILNLLTLGFISNCNFDGAIKSQLKVLDFKHRNSQIYINVSYLHYLKNDFSQAISYCEKALEINPDRPDWWRFNSKLYWMKGDFKEALNNCKIGILKNPASSQIRNQLCNFYLHSRRYDDAIVMCNNILKREPPFSFKASYKYSTYLLLDGSIKKKIINNQDYEYAITWKNLGYAYYQKKNLTRAIVAFNNSLTYNPIQPIVHYFISKIELMI